MVRTGKQVRCDRCGENKFYADGEALSVTNRIEMDGWETRLNRTLCSECTAAFDEMVEKFFNEIWDK